MMRQSISAPPKKSGVTVVRVGEWRFQGLLLSLVMQGVCRPFNTTHDCPRALPPSTMHRLTLTQALLLSLIVQGVCRPFSTRPSALISIAHW